MALHPILMPGLYVTDDTPPLPDLVAQADGRFLSFRAGVSLMSSGFLDANAVPMNHLHTLGLPASIGKMWGETRTPITAAFDGPAAFLGTCLLPEEALPNRYTAHLLRDAIGFLGLRRAPHGRPNPESVRLADLPPHDHWWPLFWLRPSTTAHDDLVRLARVRADLAALCAQSPLICADAQLGRPT